MKRLITVFVLLLALAACDSAKERAQKHYESAVALVQAGDSDRAIVELRNVFKLDGQHREGRLLYARILRDRGDPQGAYAQYLKLVEQYPDDADGLKALAQISFAAGDVKEARTRVDAALKVLPDDQELQAIDAALDYQAARSADDATAEAEALKRARALLAADPSLLPARQVVIADLAKAQEWTQALAEIDAGLKLDEKNRTLHVTRLGMLQQLGDDDGIEAELKTMVALYPDDPGVGATLVRWYISKKRLDDAEAWLRGRIKPDAADPEPRLTLVRFLAQLQGEDAALAELDRILATDPLPADVAGNQPIFRSLRAGFQFEAGQRDEAMAEMETLLDGAEPSDQTNRIKVALAQMRTATGNQVGARSLVEEVLAADPGNLEALKLKGNWLIDDDKTDDAIATLREALNVAPKDSQVMLLLARAYDRQGNHDLVGQMLSQAVQASNYAPEESLRYANYLMQDDKLPGAEDVLINALKLDSNNLQLLGMMTQLHIAMKDWPRSQRDIAALREIGGDQAEAIADEMQAQMLAAQGKADDLTAFLEGLADSDSAGLGSEAAVIRSYVQAGKLDQALDRAQAMVRDHPDAPAAQYAQYVLASVEALAGQESEAEARLRDLVASTPQMEAAWTTLYGLLFRRGDMDGAAAVLDAAQKALPDSGNLDWARAGLLERAGDTDGAIAIYEKLYAMNSDSPVIANNLASLLSSTHDDKDSLDRAWNVARRLKDTQVPPFADTYGWLAYRRGDPQEAVRYLELAAENLPQDPTVQYHLGVVYAALKQPDQARSQFEKARQAMTPEQPGIPGLSELIDKAEAELKGE